MQVKEVIPLNISTALQQTKVMVYAKKEKN
jgi:hypothetical protein